MITKSKLQTLGKPVVVATHMRSGTHLTLDLLRRQFSACAGWKWPGEALDNLYLPVDVMLPAIKEDSGWSEGRILKVLGRSSRPLCKLHWTSPDFLNLSQAQPDFSEWMLQEGKFIYVVRHPLKVLASMWTWDQASLKAELNQEWIMQKMRYWQQHVNGWRSAHPDMLVLQFEKVIKETDLTIARVAEFLDLAPVIRKPLLPSKLRGKWHSRLNRMISMSPASTEILTERKTNEFGGLFSDEVAPLVNDFLRDELNYFGYHD